MLTLYDNTLMDVFQHIRVPVQRTGFSSCYILVSVKYIFSFINLLQMKHFAFSVILFCFRAELETTGENLDDLLAYDDYCLHFTKSCDFLPPFFHICNFDLFLVVALEITGENLEDLLAYDDLFLDYFNAFLALPVSIIITSIG